MEHRDGESSFAGTCRRIRTDPEHGIVTAHRRSVWNSVLVFFSPTPVEQ